MIVHDFNFVGVAAVPAKANTPWVIYPDTVLTLPIAAELLQSVARGNPQVIEGLRGIKQEQLPQTSSSHRWRELRDRLPLEQPLRLLVAECLDHTRE